MTRSTARSTAIIDRLHSDVLKAQASLDADPGDVLKQCSLATEKKAEWYTLHSILLIPELSDGLDTGLIAARCDELRRILCAQSAA